VSVDLFAPGSPQTLALLGARVGGLVLIAPVFSTKAIPNTVKTVVIMLITVFLAPIAMSTMRTPPTITPESFISETLVGFGLGLGAALLVGAANVAGDLMGMQIGLSGAAVLDPTNNSQENVLGMFANMFALTLLLSLDAHLVMIDAVAKSIRLVPIGIGLHPEGMRAMVGSAGLLFGLGLQFSAPVICAALVANTALAILGRAAPQLNILSVAFPVQIGIGLLALAATIPFIGAFYHGWTGTYSNTLDHVLSALVRGGV
jgi:flagellar biosynthesis protein FliR